MKNIEIREAITGFSRIDKENRMLKDVSILGAESSNTYLPNTVGTRYTEGAMRTLATITENKKVYWDHQTKNEEIDNRGVRKTKDLIGYLEGVYTAGGKVKGNLKYLRTQAPRIEDIAETMPGLIGFSIHAFGPVSRVGKFGIVETFNRVSSVDLVVDAASNKGGLFESKQKEYEAAVGYKDGELQEGLSDYDRALIDDSDLQGDAHDALRERLATKNVTKAADELGRTPQDDYEDILNAPDDDF